MMNTQKLCGVNGSLELLQTNHVSSCFLQLYLVCPVHALLTAINAFYLAKHQANHTCSFPKLIKTNQFVTALIVLTVLTQIVCSMTGLQSYHPLSYYLSLTFIAFAWLLTSVYLQLKNRPPVLLFLLLVLSWGTTIIEVSTAIVKFDSGNENVDSKEHRVENFGAILRLSLQTLVIVITLILKVNWISVKTFNLSSHPGIQATASETDRLLGSEDFHVDYGLSSQEISDELTKVDENSGLLSRISFSWVYKLMKKGLCGKVNLPEDLFHLPQSLFTKTVSDSFQSVLERLHKSLVKIRSNSSSSEEKHTQSTVKKYLLLKALHKAFGVRYYSVGILKFVGDCLGFAGPLLLHALVSFMEDKNVSGIRVRCHYRWVN